MARNIRNFKKLRHWKQRFHKDAGFIWRRPKIYGAKKYKPGDPIPKELEENSTKLRRFWEAGVIELAEFKAPNVATGQVENGVDHIELMPEGVTVAPGKGTWFVVNTGTEEKNVNGKKALKALLVELKEKADKEKADKEKADKEKADKEKADKEKADKEKADKEKADKEKADKEKADKEKADKEKDAWLDGNED